MLTLRMTPNQHTSRALDAQRGCTQPATQQERSVIDQTNLKTDETDVEPVLGWKAPELLLGRPIREEHVNDLLGPARPRRMPLNLAGKLNEQQEGLREGN